MGTTRSRSRGGAGEEEDGEKEEEGDEGNEMSPASAPRNSPLQAKSRKPAQAVKA